MYKHVILDHEWAGPSIIVRLLSKNHNNFICLVSLLVFFLNRNVTTTAVCLVVVGMKEADSSIRMPPTGTV